MNGISLNSFHLVDNVEMEIVLPGDMTVRESHDIALELQHKIEGLEEVERAFVHVSDVTAASSFLLILAVCDYFFRLKGVLILETLLTSVFLSKL